MSKILFSIFVLTICCTFCNEVLGKPESAEILESSHNIVERQVAIKAVEAAVEGIKSKTIAKEWINYLFVLLSRK